MAKYTVISFDADQTLFDFDRVMHDALEAVTESLSDRCGIIVKPDELKAKRDLIASHVTSLARSMLELRHQSFREILAENNIHDASEADFLMQVFKTIRFGKVYFYEDTISVLKKLSSSFQLALITNGNSSPEKAGIDGYFHYSILGEDYGFMKPDKRLFEVLLREANIEPSQLIHVGDSLETDVKGANNAGATSVYLNRNKVKHRDNISPDYEISTLSELAAIVHA